MPKVNLSTGRGVAFIVAYTLTCDVVAKACSSPQTAELNASKRAETLMKWVHVGMVESAMVIAAAALSDRKYLKPIIAGGVLGMVVTEGEYLYARQSGLKNPGPPTEDWDNRKQEGGFVYG
jgi:hypothetical protein